MPLGTPTLGSAEGCGAKMDKSRAQENQSQIQQNLRSAAQARGDIPENHLGGGLPGTDIKHIDGAFAAEQEIQKLRDPGQYKKENGGGEKAGRFPDFLPAISVRGAPGAGKRLPWGIRGSLPGSG